MPEIAVLENKIITISDIYKFDICKTSPFLCFTCDGPLQFRQSRNAENYTEHFYHPNTVKDTHIDCERNPLDRLRTNDTWHNTLSGLIEQEYREVIRTGESVKHIVDAYDPLNDMGIEFQNSPISVEAIQSRDATTHLDWIFNVENQYIRKVQIGNRIICEIPHANWELAVKTVKNNVYLYTGYKEWILLEDREPYRIEIDTVQRNVWIGKPCSFQKIYDDTCLQNMLTQEGLTHFNSITRELQTTRIVYARCKRAMILLDDIHRRYVYKHQFQPNEILAIKSVAGSGKTTTLLELSKIHTTKKILYLAFNKALITDIGAKIKKQAIHNLHPQTFHSLARGAFISVHKREPTFTELKPQTIHNTIPWLKDKPFAVRKSAVDLYVNFCRSTILRVEDYSEKPLLRALWNSTLDGNLLTFESLLKLCLIRRWLKEYIDATYDMIMIDETQDFDMIMLQMVLKDTTLPKIFVGDPKQSIYQWRGSINGFNHLPSTALIVEFYSTFRIGDPACEIIRTKFKDCWMISKSKNTTAITNTALTLADEPYTYLFRSWKKLLLTARSMQNIWISNFELKVESIRRQHPICRRKGAIEEEFEDDLPKFLRSITEEELEDLLSAIEENITTEEDATVKFYTIHAYKGLEDNSIRIANDIEDKGGDDANLYYVALTRGMKRIVEDI
jgi:hypothetical protein